MIGDILCYETRTGVYAWLQRVFTRMRWTHTAIDVGRILGSESVLEADMTVGLHPNLATHTRIYRPVIDNQQWLELAVGAIYGRYAGHRYGFAQILWFVYRWVGELFGIDMRKKKNWFPNGEICSEVIFRYLELLSVHYRGKRNYALDDVLSEWNRDTFHAGDVVTVCQRLPQLFLRVK